MNKPVGITSRACVNQIQRILQPIKVGHAGTLDPNANGVLIVLIGQAVRLTDAIHTLPKSYIGQFQLGVTSESADLDSPITTIPNAPRLHANQIENVLDEFQGDIQQSPPIYSAVWIDGKRAHSLARQGKDFEMPVRTVRIEAIQMKSFEYPNFEISVTCGSGTYIRSLGRDIARKLGSDAVMIRLERSAIGPFKIESAIQLERLNDSESVQRSLLPARTAVEHWATMFPNEETLKNIAFGKRIVESELNANCSISNLDRAAVVDSTNELRALVKRIDENHWRADKYFPNDATFD